jgi:CRISPR/Cas system type I-B associated protein Csh2 (Cas7 group RAMP superfamily)
LVIEFRSSTKIMSEHFIRDRVFASKGEYQGKSGEVTGYKNVGLGTQKGYLVKLDENASTVCIPENELKAENLSPQEIDTQV